MLISRFQIANLGYHKLYLTDQLLPIVKAMCMIKTFKGGGGGGVAVKDAWSGVVGGH